MSDKQENKINAIFDLKINRIQAAHIFNVDVRTTTNWRKDGCPYNDDGSFTLGKLIRWMVHRYEAKLAAAKCGNETKAEAEARRAIADATMAEIELAEKLEQTLTDEAVATHISPILSVMRQRILTQPAKYNALFTGKETPEYRFKKMMDDARDILTTLALIPTVEKKRKKKKRKPSKR